MQTVGSSLDITLSPPFDARYSTDPTYLVTKIESFASFRSNNGDLSDVYQGFNNWETSSRQDDMDGVKIVTLVSDGGVEIVVPDKYFSSIDRSAMVAYVEKTIAVPISAWPENYDLTDMLTEISDAILATTGVRTVPEVINTSRPSYKTKDESDTILLNRDALKDANFNTPHMLKKALAECHSRTEALEEYITNCIN